MTEDQTLLVEVIADLKRAEKAALERAKLAEAEVARLKQLATPSDDLRMLYDRLQVELTNAKKSGHVERNRLLHYITELEEVLYNVIVHWQREESLPLLADIKEAKNVFERNGAGNIVHRLKEENQWA